MNDQERATNALESILRDHYLNDLMDPDAAMEITDGFIEFFGLGADHSEDAYNDLFNEMSNAIYAVLKTLPVQIAKQLSDQVAHQFK